MDSYNADLQEVQLLYSQFLDPTWCVLLLRVHYPRCATDPRTYTYM